jgi:glycosyltransferase involved in cell wall biosynthesis
VSLPPLLVANNYAHVRGGSDRCFLEHVRLLGRHGHTVHALATRPPSGATELALASAAELIEPVELARPALADLVRFHYSRAARGAVERLLARADAPRLAHLHIVYGQLTAALLAPLVRAGVPIVQTLHEYRLACPVSTFVSHGRLCEACSGGGTWHALARRCNRGSLLRSLASVSEHAFARRLGSESAVALFLAPSEFLRQKMIAHGVAPGRIRRLANFVDPAAHAPGQGPGEHALYFGRLERLKGVLTLARAAAEVPELPLVFAGEGEARAELETLVAAHGARHVRVLGRVAAGELAELVRGARCVVVPSEWYENLPMAVLEAFAHARAVIGTSIGGIPELVREGETGWLAPPGDAAALAGLLRRAAREGAELAELGRRARALVEAQHSPEAHYAELLSAYRTLVA